MLASELQKAEYQDYLEGYLIMLNPQIDICFEYNLLPIPLEQLSVYDNVDAVDTIVCIEDQLGLRQVALKSLVKWVDPSNVIEIWEVKHIGARRSCLLAFLSGYVKDANGKIFYSINKESMQLYSECAVLGQKLAALASKFNLTHVNVTLKGLIQQIEQANNNLFDNLNFSMIQNPFQVNACGRSNKRIKSSIEVDTSKSFQNRL
ncbi:hypothetical protein F8M41_008821 [Gigaspora margarita]|uniref:Uncharacterized protein n=1 Tax=Gigaspora margarita TaxID=4874 RepID=A0A8H3X4R7_GIGMA|nr:hypothetical protein F8M41_008821 [Gigaspora margarita]